MSSDDVVGEAGQELIKAWRAGLQVAEFSARMRQRQLARAERASAEDERRIRQTMEGERRLAEPIYTSALDSAWWERASAAQAAQVHGVATRFAHMDPRAAQAAWECQQQAQRRWGIDLQPQGPDGRPLTSGDIDPWALNQVAPSIPGEEGTNWQATLDDSAQQAQQDQAQGAQANQATAARSASGESADLVLAEQAMAVAWAKRHYSDQASPGNWLSHLDDPAGDDARDARRWAHKLYSTLAAEGHDMNNPPRLDFLDGPLAQGQALDASRGWRQDKAAATGIDHTQVDIEALIDPRSAVALSKAWLAERDGRYPDPREWSHHAVTEASKAVRQMHGEVRLVGSGPAPAGTYTELARLAAAYEANTAGMSPDAYLDSLQPHQRRDLIAGHDTAGAGLGRGRMIAYRIDYAKSAAQAWPDAAEARAAMRMAAAAHMRTDKEAAEARDALTASGGAPTTAARAEQGDEVRARGTEAAWDTHEARAQWASQQIAAGAPPEAVRAAVTGQLALHEPISKATAAHTGSPAKAGPPKTVVQAASRTRGRSL